jgi:hypothetical protein
MIKTTNSMDTRQNRYRCIGAGRCSSIWTPENAPDWVIKCEDGGNRGRSVANDQLMHRRTRIITASKRDGNGDEWNSTVRIPKSLEIIEVDDTW